MSVNLSEKRVNGGTGWADAIFRKQTHSRPYVSVIFNRIIKRSNLENSIYSILLSSKSFRIIKNRKTILKMSYSEVEHFRQAGVFSFEQFLEQEIKNNSNTVN